MSMGTDALQVSNGVRGQLQAMLCTYRLSLEVAMWPASS